MILEFAVAAGFVASAAFALRSVRRRFEAPIEPPARPVPEGPRGLRVGDVLLHGDAELWLAGALTFDEEGFVFRLFRTPGNERAAYVVQLDAEGQEIALVDPVEVPEGSVPVELPIHGHRVVLRRRGRATVTKEGDQLPHSTEHANFAWLGGAGGRALFVLDFIGGDRLAVAGELVGAELFELLPGGD